MGFATLGDNSVQTNLFEPFIFDHHTLDDNLRWYYNYNKKTMNRIWSSRATRSSISFTQAKSVGFSTFVRSSSEYSHTLVRNFCWFKQCQVLLFSFKAPLFSCIYFLFFKWINLKLNGITNCRNRWPFVSFANIRNEIPVVLQQVTTQVT